MAHVPISPRVRYIAETVSRLHAQVEIQLAALVYVLISALTSSTAATAQPSLVWESYLHAAMELAPIWLRIRHIAALVLNQLALVSIRPAVWEHAAI
ncbi:hypothetical protein N7509_003090 [Penicillium cosmopolitanum]|uniref:Uncharacterized protein n=1 Tax=Penicillium cosmopolitanum TaxID=1131564 RepID=A0A9W9W491_9EURO|nr:uncharacterized protein N7509_003090 [Penicillium cosmopolitanum]KAJ5403219.1 hypothetical protein N7509_003090 [Penicillium cosmopolitanum]